MKITQEELEEIYDSIQIGHANAIKINPKIRVAFEKFIDEKNLEGDIVIKGKNGYYRPFPLNDIDSSEFSKYIEKEYDKGLRIIEKCNQMSTLYSQISEFAESKWKELELI